MKFDIYFPTKNKAGEYRPGIRPFPYEAADIMEKICGKEEVEKLVKEIRESGNKELKKQLPSICWVATCSGTRANENASPTGLVMVDIDHVKLESAEWLWEKINEKIINFEGEKPTVPVVHATPSGGLRIIFVARKGAKSLKDEMSWFKDNFFEKEWGDFDMGIKDNSRISFLVPPSEFFRFHTNFLSEYTNESSIDFGLDEKPEGDLFEEEKITFTDEEKAAFDNLEYRGTNLKHIIEKYVEFFGEPSQGEKHNYYNEMVKNFRCISDNNKRALLYLLPRFGHTLEECWSQVKSICKVNTLSTLPKKFYFFLKDNGFYQTKVPEGKLKEYMMSEKEETIVYPPYLPPVFRELVRTAPPDFVIPCVNALLPILGTLTSYVQSRYPYDDRMHTTSFFSVVYAPPGTGKGFVERFMDLLFEDLKIRDFVQSERENIYLRTLNKKGANDKAPDMPHTSLRLIPPKNSEAEFLQKQRDNHGYHMFTYAAELDSWAKGVKAAGGNKDDMIRIAWDNGEYGQQFKSANTFKGIVNLFWNVLITGTLQQVESYFKNVENGLVTRCSFTSIENQEFAQAPKWKSLSEKAKRAIRNFTMRCDMNTYAEPCTINVADLVNINDDDFDKEVDWKFEFREKKTVDCSWIMPVIDQFHREQMSQAVLDVDKARDVFRRRVGVRGFRLALLCTCLWENPRKKDLEKCKSFVKWWMEQDLASMLKLWGQKYNEQADVTPKLVQRTVFNELPATFSRSDVYVVCNKQGIKTPIRRIIFDWKKLKYIEQIDKETFKKL